MLDIDYSRKAALQRCHVLLYIVLLPRREFLGLRTDHRGVSPTEYLPARLPAFLVSDSRGTGGTARDSMYLDVEQPSFAFWDIQPGSIEDHLEM